VIAERSFEVLLFDLGGVLIDFAGFAELPRLLRDPPSRSEIRGRWIHSEPVQRFERGDIAANEFARSFVAEWELEISPQVFLAEFTSWARGLYPGANELLGRLRASYRLACLSNSNELHTPLHREAVRPYVERCFFSNELGLVKPQPAIYEHVVGELAVPPARIALFDDTTINVEAAARAGMNAYLTDGLADLEQTLRSLGL
jgi:HAD superfamily hydrolase (TIGR01509 family)